MLASSSFRTFIVFCRLVLWLGCLLMPALLFGAELHLINGDRITGEFLRRENGKIYFRSTLLGDIAVPETQAVVVDAPETPVESLTGLPPKPGSPSASSESTPERPGPTVATSTPSQRKWKGKIEFGYQQQTGREDLVNLSTRGEADKVVGIDSYHADARYLYGKQTGAINSDRYDANLRWRHELSERIFAQALSSYTKDRVKQIDQNIEQNLGFGYRLLQNQRNSANIGAGLTAQYREAFGVSSGVSYLGEVFQDYTYKLTGRLTFIQDSSLLYSPTRRSSYVLVGNDFVPSDSTAENYRFRFNATLQGNITQRISMNLRFEYEFDNSILNGDAKADQRITSSIGYGF